MKPKFSLTKKAVIFICIFAVILIASSVIVCGRLQTKLIDRQYKDDVNDLARTITSVIDKEQCKRFTEKVKAIYQKSEKRPTSEDWGSEDFEEYIAQFTDLYNDEDYKSLLSFLRGIQAVNKVDCIYITFIDTVNNKVIYTCDAALEDPCPIGCIDPLYTDPAEVRDGYPAYITNTEAYGHLVTAGFPINDEKGGMIGYAFADNSMNDIQKEKLDSILKLTVYLVLAAATLIIIIVLIMNRHVIKPLKMLSDSAYAYCHDENSIMHNKFSSINIKSNDEIRTLADSMKKMEEDLNHHIAKLFTTNNELLLSKDETDKMKDLATKDALTGIRNKTAYDYEIKKIEKKIQDKTAKFGIAMIDLNFLKQTNDNHGHECGDEALKKLSQVICSVFVHSPVFRVGGDEFTVLLENNDYDKIEELTNEFREKIERIYNNESLKPWERISAAIGYSLFDPKKDDDVSDVFRRADEQMYAIKHQMKENGTVPIL